MSDYIHKSHNVTVLLYHFVCPAKYRRVVFTDNVDKSLKEICIGISDRYEIAFIEIGTDNDHVHFLIQSVPMYSPTKIIQIVKKYNCKGNIKTSPRSKKTTFGRRILD